MRIAHIRFGAAHKTGHFYLPIGLLWQWENRLHHIYYPTHHLFRCQMKLKRIELKMRKINFHWHAWHAFGSTKKSVEEIFVWNTGIKIIYASRKHQYLLWNVFDDHCWLNLKLTKAKKKGRKKFNVNFKQNICKVTLHVGMLFLTRRWTLYGLWLYPSIHNLIAKVRSK